jgi:hypothetical protein
MILIRNKVSELTNMFIAKPIAKLFAFKKLTKTEYSKDIKMEAIIPAIMP